MHELHDFARLLAADVESGNVIVRGSEFQQPGVQLSVLSDHNHKFRGKYQK